MDARHLLGGQGTWLTAKHCVKPDAQETFGLVSTTFTPRVVGTVCEVIKHPELDLAMAAVDGRVDQTATVGDLGGLAETDG